MQEILAGRYELLDVLGRGGMGVVYRATDRVLARPVAVKILPVDRAEDPSLVARFEREALAAAALNHPNVVAVYDTGRDADTRFIVMEYIPGRNLAQLLRERGRLPAKEALGIGAHIAAAIAAAHRAGLIHRDIKPANVMVDESGRVKVLDFGIVRSSTSTSLTQTANVIGSAPYLAPEVTRGEPADERSDVYSLGCVLCEMLTGRPPFGGELPAAIMHQHNSTQPPALRELNPAVPPAVEALVTAMLAKQPAERPGDGELARALAMPLEDPPAAAGTAATAAISGTAATTPLVTPTAVTAPVVHDATPLAQAANVLAGTTRRLGRRGQAVIAAVALVAIALVALAVAGGSSSPRPQQSFAPRVRSTSSPPTSGTAAPRSTTTAPVPQATTSAPAPAATAEPGPAGGSARGNGQGDGHGKGHGAGAKDKGPPAGKGPHH